MNVMQTATINQRQRRQRKVTAGKPLGRPSFGYFRWLTNRRLRLDLTQAELGRKCFANPVTVGRWELGSFPPSWEYVPRMAEALECTEEELCREILQAFYKGGIEAEKERNRL